MADEPKGIGLDAELHAYLVTHGSEPDAITRDLIAQTQRLGGVSMMQIAPEQAAFMAMLVQISGATRALDGHTLAVRRRLPPLTARQTERLPDRLRRRHSSMSDHPAVGRSA